LFPAPQIEVNFFLPVASLPVTSAGGTLNWSFETIAARFRAAPEDSFTLGAFDGGQLVGTATFRREPGLKEKHKAHFRSICSPQRPAQRRGSSRSDGEPRSRKAALPEVWV